MEKLNKGIVKTVKFLRENGFDTKDSGDGETHDFDCDLTMPYVHMIVKPNKIEEESHRLKDLLEVKGIKFGSKYMAQIEATYSPIGQAATLSIYNIKL